jgi:hypothetical protein
VVPLLLPNALLVLLVLHPRQHLRLRRHPVVHLLLVPLVLLRLPLLLRRALPLLLVPLVLLRRPLRLLPALKYT